MRADMIVDGFTFSRVTVGGMDATEKIVEMYLALKRNDINIMLLNGCIISWYNIIDLRHLAEVIKLPLICVTYKDSEGLEKYLVKHFPKDWQVRVDIYNRNGSRKPIKLQTNHVIYARFLNINEEETRIFLNKFTHHGSMVEPLRIARLLARALMKRQLSI